jgi:hypothetical protein
MPRGGMQPVHNEFDFTQHRRWVMQGVLLCSEVSINSHHLSPRKTSHSISQHQDSFMRATPHAAMRHPASHVMT